jgi:hypothetical protein
MDSVCSSRDRKDSSVVLAIVDDPAVIADRVRQTLDE